MSTADPAVCIASKHCVQQSYQLGMQQSHQLPTANKDEVVLGQPELVLVKQFSSCYGMGNTAAICTKNAQLDRLCAAAEC